jgi:hypothetical protein
VRDDGQPGPDVRFARGQERLALVGIHRHGASGPHLADGSPSLGCRERDEVVGDLVGALSERVGRVIAFEMQTTGCDDEDAGAHRNRAERPDVPEYTGVDDAADAVGGAGLHFVGDERDVVVELQRGVRPLDRQVFVDERRSGDAFRRDVFEQRPDDRATRECRSADLRSRVGADPIAERLERADRRADAEPPDRLATRQPRPGVVWLGHLTGIISALG